MLPTNELTKPEAFTEELVHNWASTRNFDRDMKSKNEVQLSKGRPNSHPSATREQDGHTQLSH